MQKDDKTLLYLSKVMMLLYCIIVKTTKWLNAILDYMKKARLSIQILNVTNNQLITISMIGCPPSTIDVYDSMHLRLQLI